MTASLIAACVWVLLASVVAMFPMQRQYLPGVVLLLAAPVLIGWLAWDHGVLVGFAALFGFVSMFRHPLRYLYRRFQGQSVERPK
nr:DUF2484 family protein [uncultured Shimia sp.]